MLFGFDVVTIIFHLLPLYQVLNLQQQHSFALDQVVDKRVRVACSSYLHEKVRDPF
ncbi:hypothetical protein HanPSC8_Chr12g0506391 [Helianthus annuus]|nr:hypothetical protein HanPSC8_Chr12g0506391 [Helianthus annuus]